LKTIKAFQSAEGKSETGSGNVTLTAVSLSLLIQSRRAWHTAFSRRNSIPKRDAVSHPDKIGLPHHWKFPICAPQNRWAQICVEQPGFWPVDVPSFWGADLWKPVVEECWKLTRSFWG